MMWHPARMYEYDDLLEGLLAEIEEGNIRRICGDNGLALYTYAEQCTYNRNWNAITVLARGLILDEVNGKVVATPFPKFFNYGEISCNAHLPFDKGFEVFDKLDGSLIILFYHNGEWKTATKGSFNSDQAKWAKRYVDTRFKKESLHEGWTYLFGAIYPENKIVVNYRPEQTGLHLLGVYTENGHELSYNMLFNVSLAINSHLVVRHTFANFADLLDKHKSLSSNEEGFVIRFNSDGYRVKLKGEEYVKLHRLIFQVTPLSIWEMMKDGRDMEKVKAELPDEFYADFDAICSRLYAKAGAISVLTMQEVSRLHSLSDKEVGLLLHTINQPVRSFIFPMRKDPACFLKKQ